MHWRPGLHPGRRWENLRSSPDLPAELRERGWKRKRRNHHPRRVVRVDRCAAPWPLHGDLRSPQRRQRYSVGILLNLVEPDVARSTRRSSLAGHWLSAFVGIHRQTQSIMCWYCRVQACNKAKELRFQIRRRAAVAPSYLERMMLSVCTTVQVHECGVSTGNQEMGPHYCSSRLPRPRRRSIKLPPYPLHDLVNHDSQWLLIMYKGGGEEGWERDGVKGERVWRGRRGQGKGRACPNPASAPKSPLHFIS